MWIPFFLFDLSLSTTARQSSAPPPTVVVQAYTESLCIDCKNFIDHQLVPTYHKLGPSVIDLKIVPFGNAEITDPTTQSISCQHGPGECDANSWEQVAVEQYTPKEYITYLGCLETTLPMGQADQLLDRDLFQGCAEVSFLDFDSMAKLHDNPLYAYQLQQKYAKLTPAHDHVPWVVVNGEHFDEEHDDLLATVCQEYEKGGGTHPACTSTDSREQFSSSNNSLKK